MGSDVHLIVVGGAASLPGDAARRLEDLEQRWSRFRPDSEVNRLNRGAGQPVRVSPETLTLVARAVEAWRLSGGAFDPTVLGALIRAGYDRSFERLGPAAPSGHSTLGLGAGDIRMDGDDVSLPAGTGFDPGGIGKGLAADILTDELLAAGAEGACVNLGGDVRVGGAGPDGGTWTVAVDRPSEDEPLVLLGLARGAAATSTTLRRRWSTDGEARHHLIDPQTGRPSDTDLVLASVVAGEAWIAEVLAKAVLLAGSAHPFDIVGGTGAEALAVGVAGQVLTSPGLAAFLGPAAVPECVPARAGELGLGADSAIGPRAL
jgi:thiamine biosynthesis lipoprotein